MNIQIFLNKLYNYKENYLKILLNIYKKKWSVNILTTNYNFIPQ